MSVSTFYDRFERHNQGEGIKGHATHYCAGCGHGLAHKFMAEAIDELGIQDRTIAISPVGCSVFLYYYLDVGNSQAAHGRAPVVAVGHKLANPESVVISYQGDGDLAAIGLAETFHTAQTGLPISVIFINNAIYGMTGGQMAPTTLLGQPTTTTPRGRERVAGLPMRMAELMAQLDGPVYVERVALFNAKQRVRAKKAIKKAIQLQVENKGYTFVEVLSECPTHLKMTPLEAEKWVEEKMVPLFPLGVLKDVSDQVTPEMEFKHTTPSFDPEEVKALITEGGDGKVERYTSVFPEHIASEDISLKLDGGPPPHPHGHQRGVGFHPHPLLRPRVTGRHLLRRRAHRQGGSALSGLSPAQYPHRLQRPQPGEVRTHRRCQRRHHLRQLRHLGSPLHQRHRQDVRGAPHRDRREPRPQGHQERGGPWGPPGRDQPLPGGDLPGGHSAGPGVQVRHDSHERGGLPVGTEGGAGGDGEVR
jgi:pyruvate/2-oxoacid:ferredoxin oxidoreductase beta subunit